MLTVAILELFNGHTGYICDHSCILHAYMYMCKRVFEY